MMIDLLFNPVYDESGAPYNEWYWRGVWDVGGRTLHGKAQGPFASRQQAINAFRRHWTHANPTREMKFTEGDNV